MVKEPKKEVKMSIKPANKDSQKSQNKAIYILNTELVINYGLYFSRSLNIHEKRKSSSAFDDLSIPSML